MFPASRNILHVSTRNLGKMSRALCHEHGTSYLRQTRPSTAIKNCENIPVISKIWTRPVVATPASLCLLVLCRCSRPGSFESLYVFKILFLLRHKILVVLLLQSEYTLLLFSVILTNIVLFLWAVCMLWVLLVPLLCGLFLFACSCTSSIRLLLFSFGSQWRTSMSGSRHPLVLMPVPGVLSQDKHTMFLSPSRGSSKIHSYIHYAPIRRFFDIITWRRKLSGQCKEVVSAGIPRSSPAGGNDFSSIVE